MEKAAVERGEAGRKVRGRSHKLTLTPASSHTQLPGPGSIGAQPLGVSLPTRGPSGHTAAQQAWQHQKEQR